MKIEGHISLNELVNNLLLKHSSSSNAIDENYLNLTAYNYLKTLGANVCLLKYTYVHVKDNIAYLDKDFRSCNVALLVEPESYFSHNIKLSKRTKIYHEFIDRNNLSCRSECLPKTCDFVETIEEEVPITIFYKNPRKLRVVDKKFYVGESVKTYFPLSSHKIEIYNNEITASFKEGTIALSYWSLPTDEDGIPLIPETKYNHIYSYIEKLLEVKIMEMPEFMKTNPEYIKAFYGTFKQELGVLKNRAETEARGFTIKDIVNVQRDNNAKYNNHRNQIPL